jgi:hypothetical protein
MALQWIKTIPYHGWLKLAATGTAIGIVSAVSISFVEKWSKTHVYSLLSVKALQILKGTKSS